MRKEISVNAQRLSQIGLLAAFAFLLVSAAQQSNAQTICSSQTGTNNGFFYSFYLSSGSACMTLTDNYGGGNYSTNWSLGSSGDMVAGKGWNPGSPDMVVGYRAAVRRSKAQWRVTAALTTYIWPSETGRTLRATVHSCSTGAYGRRNGRPEATRPSLLPITSARGRAMACIWGPLTTRFWQQRDTEAAGALT
jgi:Glycosyl hydrolases family 11